MKKIITRTRDEVYHLWVAALRSGRYQQSRFCLRDIKYRVQPVTRHYVADGQGGGFCCLGVLCDLAVRDGGSDWNTGEGPSFVETEPPPYITEFMGLDQDMVDKLVSMNDDRGANFKEIADVIEQDIMPALGVK